MITLPLAVTLGSVNIPPGAFVFLIPIAGIIFGGAIAISAMYFNHRQRELWHATARVALEKGQPMPDYPYAGENTEPSRRRGNGGRDLRSGLVLIGVGAGLYFFLGAVSGPDVALVGLIPGFIGLALLLYALLTRSSNHAGNPPPSA